MARVSMLGRQFVSRDVILITPVLNSVGGQGYIVCISRPGIEPRLRLQGADVIYGGPVTDLPGEGFVPDQEEVYACSSWEEVLLVLKNHGNGKKRS